ncbi:MAG: hypothetical protein KAV45_02590 [Calditrichia bacterium]|nr:hypothetical protein [Calditrichia bacterium]
MARAVQTQKRIKLLDTIIRKMSKHELFSENVNRRHDTEAQIQKALFLRLQDELPKILQSQFGFTKEKAQKTVHKEFLWEKNVNTTVNNFTFFATNHRPDSVFSIDKELRIAIEIKKGDSGSALRSGIGQALVYSTQFDFVIYFFVDISPGFDIKSSFTGRKEKELINSLWQGHNIKFKVV